MKEVVDYHSFDKSMGELLDAMGISLSKDFTHAERESLRNHLESYIKKVNSSGSEATTLDIKNFYLKIQGADEASYLLQLL